MQGRTKTPLESVRQEFLEAVFGPDAKEKIEALRQRVVGTQPAPETRARDLWNPAAATEEDPAPAEPAPAAEERLRYVLFMAGTPAEVDRVQEAARRSDDGEPFSTEDCREIRELALGMLQDQADRGAPEEFVYDCIPTMVEQDGQRFDVYVVRGSDDALGRLNEAFEAIGGRCEWIGEKGPVALRYALKVMGGPCNEIPIGEEVGPPAAPAEKPPKPSKISQRLREKYGVRRAQLIRYGMPEEKATFIADYVANALRQGIHIVEAIEEAEYEWCLQRKDCDICDRLFARVLAGLTVPRLIESGWPRDKAFFASNFADPFVEVGCDLKESVELMGAAWDMWQKDPEGFPEKWAKIQQVLRKARAAFIAAKLVTEGREVRSGAGWVGETAAALCREMKRAGRRYTMEEATEQAMDEWANMTRSERAAVRRATGVPPRRASSDDVAFSTAWAQDYFDSKWRIPKGGSLPTGFLPRFEDMVNCGCSLKDAADKAVETATQIGIARRLIALAGERTGR